jgi:hypothetical protein
MGALVLDHLLGPHPTPILTAGYEGFTKGSWSVLVQTFPRTPAYIRMPVCVYCPYNVALSLPVTSTHSPFGVATLAACYTRIDARRVRPFPGTSREVVRHHREVSFDSPLFIARNGLGETAHASRDVR